MPRPATLADAIGLVHTSGLLDDAVVRDFVAHAERADPLGLTPDGLFVRMVEGTLLTPFQARQLSEGRWRGLVLGDYHLKARIGRGGMGQVFRGEHRRLRHSVAVKVLHADLADDRTAKARLVREARATAALDHPHIVKFLGLDADHSPPYLVMEYIDGLSLQALVALTGTLRLEAAVLCGRQVALGLAHAAEAGLVHRDIKPANLLLDRFGTVKILDLGIVLLPGEAARLTLAPDGLAPILGTVDYLAPEQALDSHGVDGRADIYALGGTLYFLLAGQPPFAHGDPATRLRRKQVAEPPPIHTLRPDVPEALSAVVSKMLAPRRADRYQGAQEVADALAPWASPVAGFPEDLFSQMTADEWSGEFQTKAKSGGFDRDSVHRARPPASAAAERTVAISVILTPTGHGLPAPRILPEAGASAAIPPRPPKPACPSSVIIRKRVIEPRRRATRSGTLAVVGLVLLVLVLGIAWLLVARVNRVAADSTIRPACASGEFGRSAEYAGRR